MFAPLCPDIPNLPQYLVLLSFAKLTPSQVQIYGKLYFVINFLKSRIVFEVINPFPATTTVLLEFNNNFFNFKISISRFLL